MPENPPTTDTRNARVADWLRRTFAAYRREYGSDAILQTELIRMAWAANIDLTARYNAPEIQAIGIRSVSGEVHAGAVGQFFTLEEKGKS